MTAKRDSDSRTGVSALKLLCAPLVLAGRATCRLPLVVFHLIVRGVRRVGEGLSLGDLGAVGLGVDLESGKSMGFKASLERGVCCPQEGPLERIGATTHIVQLRTVKLMIMTLRAFLSASPWLPAWEGSSDLLVTPTQK